MKKLHPGDTALGIMLPGDISKIIDKWRHDYDPYYIVIPPHITLAFPPFVPEHAWLPNREKMKTLIAAFDPFKVMLQNLKTFKGGEFVLWLEPEDNGSLQNIHNELRTLFPQYFLTEHDIDFVPHVTIGFFNTDHDIQQAQQKLQDEMKPMYFLAKEIVYIKINKQGQGEIEDKFFLGRN